MLEQDKIKLKKSSIYKLKNIEDFFVCHLCNKQFKTESSLKHHYYRKHKEYSTLKRNQEIEELKKTIVENKYNGCFPLCKCGCGNQTTFEIEKKDFNVYIRGHVSRIKNNYQTIKSITNSRKTKKERAESGVYKGILKSEEHKKKMSESSANRLSTFKRVSSKLEVLFEEKYLKPLEVKYTKQFYLNRSFYDFKIQDRNILIEVDGDFWHSNPLKYPNGPVYPVQQESYRKDILKNQIAADNNFELIRFWEYEIKNNSDEVIKKIIKILEK